MKKHKFHFIYKITRGDGFFYIGRHSTNKIDDGYLGSGLRISRSVAKYGAEAHRRDILEFTTTYEELKTREAEIVTAKLLSDPKCLNLALGGHGGFERGSVSVLLEDGTRTRVSKNEFYSNRSVYAATNDGKCPAKNLKTGKSEMILISDLDGVNFIHHCADKIFAQTENGNRFVSREEFINNSYRGINYGRVEGFKNPHAKVIKIYDEHQNERFICHGNFTKVCRDNLLPFVALRKSYVNGGSKIYKDPRSQAFAKKFGFDAFIGWSAVATDKGA